MIALRRDIHMHPEVGYEEFRTAALVKSTLEACGYENVISEVGVTGVVAVLYGEAGPGPTVMLRADMDGLPVQETTNISYASVYPGKMHACGHDNHVAILLGTACAMKEDNWAASLRGAVKFVFQPAEEGGAGALAMVDDPIYPVLASEPKVDLVFGLHVWAEFPIGQIATQPGPLMANSDRFYLKINGPGGHGSAPHTTIDLVMVAAQLVTAFHTIVSRDIDPFDVSVVTIGTINCGVAENVIGDECLLSGTARTFDAGVQAAIVDRMEAIVSGLGLAYGAEMDFEYRYGYPAVVNSVEETRLVMDVAERIVGETMVVEDGITTGGEDFAYFLLDPNVEGNFFFLGGRWEEYNDDDFVPGHHSSSFLISDERTLAVGASIFLELVEDILVL